MLIFPVLTAIATLLPLPMKLAWEIEPERTMPSVLEKPAPSASAPVGFSTTLRLMSIWSEVPWTGGVSTAVSVK